MEEVIAFIDSWFSHVPALSGGRGGLATDLAASLVAAGVFSTVRLILDNTLFPAIVRRSLAVGERRKKPLSKSKVESAVKSAWNAIAYGILSIAALAALRREPNFIKRSHMLWVQCAGVPCQAPRALHLRLAYAAEIGWYLYALPALFFKDARQRDFPVLATHHFVTLGLLVSSMVLNYLKVGVLTMFLHDICDVFLDGGKLANALGLPVEPFFVLFIGVWVATRLYLFPAVVVRSVLFETREWVPKTSPNFTAEQYREGMTHYYFFGALLCALLVMHVYWTYLIACTAIRALGRSGVGVEDVREDGGKHFAATRENGGGGPRMEKRHCANGHQAQLGAPGRPADTAQGPRGARA